MSNQPSIHYVLGENTQHLKPRRKQTQRSLSPSFSPLPSGSAGSSPALSFLFLPPLWQGLVSAHLHPQPTSRSPPLSPLCSQLLPGGLSGSERPLCSPPRRCGPLSIDPVSPSGSVAPAVPLPQAHTPRCEALSQGRAGGGRGSP